MLIKFLHLLRNPLTHYILNILIYNNSVLVVMLYLRECVYYELIKGLPIVFCKIHYKILIVIIVIVLGLLLVLLTFGDLALDEVY